MLHKTQDTRQLLLIVTKFWNENKKKQKACFKANAFKKINANIEYNALDFDGRNVVSPCGK